MSEYAFEGFVYGQKAIWADSFKNLGDARRAAKTWIDRTPSRTVLILQKEPRPAGHEYGATWKFAGAVRWTT